MIGRKWAIGREPSRPMTDTGHRRAAANLGRLNEVEVPVEPAVEVIGRRRQAANRVDAKSEPVDRAAHAERSTIEHVRVDHRRADIRMPEQFLHGSDVVAVLEQVRGE